MKNALKSRPKKSKIEL